MWSARRNIALAAAAFVGGLVLGWLAAGDATIEYIRILAILLGLSLAAIVGLALVALDRQRAFLRMQEAEQSFRDLYDNISEGVSRSTLDGRMISANPSLVRLNGYETEAELLAGCNDIAKEWYVDPNRRAEIHRELQRSGRVTTFISEIYRHNTRERIWVEENTRLVCDKQTGRPLYYDGTVREVTETIRRLELQGHYDKIASIVSGCLYQFRLTPDGASSLPYASTGLINLFGVAPTEVATDAAELFARVHPEDLARLNASIEQSRLTLRDWQCEFRVRLPDGRENWIFGHSTPEREADGSTLWHGYLSDISERKRSEATIHELAYFDPLTRLPNRTMLRQRLDQALAASARSGAFGAILFIDLDQFKMLNDTKGHHIGDLLLCELAERLRACVRQVDLVARLGGDEFVVLLDAVGSSSENATARVREIGANILAAIDRPFSAEDYEFQTTASIGVALFSSAEAHVDDILKRADLAMYEAKTMDPGSLLFFEPHMQAAVDDRMVLTSDLRSAQLEDRLRLEYQPQVDRSGWWYGAEALLRWDHPTRGPIPPAELIPLAERSGLMDTVERWVLRTACLTLKEWEHDSLTRDLHLAVNISADQMNRLSFVAAVETALAETDADPSRLTLELTEHVMLNDVSRVREAMLKLKARGISFALDDFGTGYSSLSYLKRLPIDILKIDRSFVRDIAGEASDREIVQTILSIARGLQVSTVAEGVETETQAHILRQLGCHAFQGFLFAHPMRLEEFVAKLRASESAAGHVRHPALARVPS